MSKSKEWAIAAVVAMLLALLPFLRTLNNPRLANLHFIDRLQLIGVGLFLGFGLCCLAAARDTSRD